MFTRGPWEYFEAKTADGDETIGIRGSAEFIATMDVTSVNGGPFVLPANGKANARLIASSPALLEALQTLVAMNDCHYDRYVDDYVAAMVAAKAAIRQAIGEAVQP